MLCRNKIKFESVWYHRKNILTRKELFIGPDQTSLLGDTLNQAIKLGELIIACLTGTGFDNSSNGSSSLLSNKVNKESICHVNTCQHVNPLVSLSVRNNP